MSTGLESTMIKARKAQKSGDFTEAERLYRAVLERFPGNARARRGLDRLGETRAAAVMRADAPPRAALDRLSHLYGQGQLAQTVLEAEALLVQHPRAAILYNLLAAAYLGLGRPERAEAALRGALAQGIRHPAMCSNLGIALAQLGRHDEAIGAYREAIALNPRYATAHNNLGNALKEAGRLDEAVEAYNAALAIDAAYADACNNLGLALRDLHRFDEAQRAFRQALRLMPGHAAACNNLGNLLADMGDLAAAVTLYEKAVRLDPAYADAHFNLGNAFKKQGRLADAHAAYRAAQAAKPDHAGAWTEHAKALALEGDMGAAIAALDKALELDPDDLGAQAHHLVYRAYVCDWSAFADFAARGAALDGAISPWAFLTFEDDPQRQFERSAAWAKASAWPRPVPIAGHAPSPAGKIRIGYFSADFHNHATMYLLSGLLREHDRNRFEIHAFSFGPASDDAMRAQILGCVDSFTEIADTPDAAVAELARGVALDIAVDLKGYTQGSRAALFAQRLAPLQIGFLGYPGTMAAPAIDYLVADPVVVPPAERAHYAEKLLYLPDCYQPNDERRAIAAAPTARSDFGLPEDGFVFCCFNQNYKITPREFAVWTRLLDQVEGSVLWLLRWNAQAEANLRREAVARGIDPDRLVFAEPLPQAEHLARLAHADLFLDTFAVNAHTTASDALWAGVPVVTLAGRQFAARVAASLLSAVGLPELVTAGEAQYEALCRDLAASPERLSAIRGWLLENRESQPLFDTRRHARALEAAYAAAWERHRAGLAPDDIVITGGTPRATAKG